jgi:protein-tyrosine phosphatase
MENFAESIAVTTRWSRFIPLDGPINFRDLGGYSALGNRVVRRGALYRSDAHDTLSPADITLLTDGIGVRSIIDLRSSDEVHETGLSPLTQRGAKVYNVPLVDDGLAFWGEYGESLAERYLVVVRASAGRIVSALDLLASMEGPTVFHCAAGKDRTGLVAAIALHLLGVSDQDIAFDFALTERILPDLRDRIHAQITQNPALSATFDSAAGRAHAAEMISARASTMRAVLAILRADYGSVEAWLRAAGLESRTIRRLRQKMLVAA